MPTISKGRTPLTLINVFTATPEKQDELIALLTDVTAQNVRHHEGFISASLHRGLDGRKLTMYAQWASNGGVRSAGCMRSWKSFFPMGDRPRL